jgi:hypothetical protein
VCADAAGKPYTSHPFFQDADIQSDLDCPTPTEVLPTGEDAIESFARNPVHDLSVRLDDDRRIEVKDCEERIDG